jgi:hypothetical protein
VLLKALLAAPLAALLILFSFIVPASASRYYADQADFAETTVPKANYRWDANDLQWCVYKEDGIAGKYYTWAKLAIHKWRMALKDYTEARTEWNMPIKRAVSKEMPAAGCDVSVYIYDTYRDFPAYPEQTGAYTAVEYTNGVASSASVYMSPQVLHGDGKSVIDLPGYAFRNSAVHEVGHVLGLGHMAAPKGYLMSPMFDFWELTKQLPITTLELSTLTDVYGTDGFAS